MQVIQIRRETSEIIAALEIAKCRASLLEREKTEKMAKATGLLKSSKYL